MSFRETYVVDQDGEYSSSPSYVETFPQLTIFLQRQFSNKLSFTTEATTTTTTDSSNIVGDGRNTYFQNSNGQDQNLFTTISSTAISIIQGIMETSNDSYISSSEMSEDVDYDVFDNVTGIPVLPESRPPFFDAAEYGVFLTVLLCSSAIGVYYGCFGQKSTTEEYLIANRQMSTVPAALSLLCSFISAITILGNPVEIYLYGSAYGLILISFIPLTLSLAYLYVPVYHNLQLNSVYEYLELRFSRSVRTVVSFVGIIHYVIYMAIVVYAPSLAIGQVTGISTRMSTAVIFIVCIFYSTLGGLKAVILTDALQAIIMIGSLSAIVWRGISDLGGLEVVWDVASQFERTEFFNFDLDPRTRHTFWTATIGGYFQWLPYFAASHSQVQRYLSMANLASIRRALLLNLIGFTITFGLCFLIGLTLFGKYHNCDPIQLGTINHTDQLLPLYIMDSMTYPGLPGLFVAGLTCASLSSVSSGLNAISAVITFDYMKNWMPTLTDANLLKLSRCFCVLFGSISFGCIFVAEYMGNILPAAFATAGILIGPTLGIFSLGLFFPFANSKGSLLGLLCAFLLMISLVVGNLIADSEKLLPDQTLPGLNTDGCQASSFSNISSIVAPMSSNISLINESLEHLPRISSFKDLDSEFLIDIFCISYMWYPGLGWVLSIIFGVIFSFIITKCEKSKAVNPDHLSPPVLWILIRLFPEFSAKWIDFDEDYPVLSSNSSATATLSLRSADFTFRKESVCEMKLKRLPYLKP